MDGIHDLGGMHGFGAVEVEENEPVFHDAWEGRVNVMLGRVLQAGIGNVDRFRHAIERMPSQRYLSSSYYERWMHSIETLLVEHGELTWKQIEAARERVRCGKGAEVQQGAERLRPPILGAKRQIDRRPKFAVEQVVRTMELRPTGHTRLPRYASGKRGRIGAIYPAFVYPDANAHDGGEQPQHVYAVLFEGEELWGAEAEQGTRVSLDLFESYLEAADDLENVDG